MGNVMSFVGGIVALVVLGFLLWFELNREQMIFVYVISALIILVLGAMLAGIRDIVSPFRFFKRMRLKRKHPGKVKENAPEEGKEEPEPPERLQAPKEGKAPEKGKTPEAAKPEGQKTKRKPRLPALKFWKRQKGGTPKRPEKVVAEPTGEEEKMLIRQRVLEGADGPGKEKPGKKAEPAGRRQKGGEDIPAKPRKRAPAGDSCQICGEPSDPRTHYITPLDKGGKKEKSNAITLCRMHREQAERGIYSENLLRKLKSA